MDFYGLWKSGWLVFYRRAVSAFVMSAEFFPCCYLQNKSVGLEALVARRTDGQWQWCGGERQQSSQPRQGWRSVRGKGVSACLWRGHLQPQPSSAGWDSGRQRARHALLCRTGQCSGQGTVGLCLALPGGVRSSHHTAALLILLLPVFYFFRCICLHFCQHWSCLRAHDEIILMINEQPLSLACI